MRATAAAICAGLSAWCSFGSIGLLGAASVASRVALMPPWWLLPLLIVAAFATIRGLRLSSTEVSPLFGSAVILLPWLPVPVPPVALLWTGPFAAGIWVIVIAGVLLARRRGGDGRWFADARRAPLVAAAIALVLYGASAWWLSPILPEGDGPHYLIITQSLIKDGDLRIENNHRRGDYLEYSLTAAEPEYLRRGVNGEIYPIHTPGLPVLSIPAMVLFGYPGVVAFLAIVAALSTALVWRVTYRVTDSVSAAWFGWASCALTTPFFFQATQVFPDGIAATFLLLGLLPLMVPPRGRTNQSHTYGATSRDIFMWVLSGASLAMLPWLHPRLSILAGVAAGCLCFRLRSAKQLAWFAIVPVASAIGLCGYFYVVYGTPDPRASFGPDSQSTMANLFRGFPALLFDQQFGLIPNAPFCNGFILAGVLAGVVRFRRWSWEVLALVVPYMAAVGMYQMWWGGTTVAGRLLTPITLVLAVAAARIWHESRTRTTRLSGLVALAASAIITAMLVGPDHGHLLFNFRDGVALWAEWANDTLDLPRALPSFFRDDPSQARLKIAIWVAGAVAGWLTLRVVGRRSREPQHERPTLALTGTTIWCLSVTLMIAFTLAWGADARSPLTPETSAVGLLRDVSPFRSIAYDFVGQRFQGARSLLSGARLMTDPHRREVPPGSLLSVRDVPAGAYDLHVTARGAAEGALVLRLGDTMLPFFTAQSDEAPAASSTLPIRLPVGVRSLSVDGDAAALRSISSLALGSVASDDGFSFNGASGAAHRGAHYMSTDAFFLDENAYPEPTGFWVAGGRTAEVVVGNARAPFGLFLRNSPVDNTVTIDVNGESQELTLGPGEERLVTLPGTRPGSYAMLKIRSRVGFRPSQAEPGNADLRYLGCWVESR